MGEKSLSGRNSGQWASKRRLHRGIQTGGFLMPRETVAGDQDTPQKTQRDQVAFADIRCDSGTHCVSTGKFWGLEAGFFSSTCCEENRRSRRRSKLTWANSKREVQQATLVVCLVALSRNKCYQLTAVGGRSEVRSFHKLVG